MTRSTRPAKAALASIGCAIVLAAGVAAAQAQPAEESVAEARALYAQGVELVQTAQWADALAAFEKSLRLRPHPTTRFNIGACERALGRYARARLTLETALAENEATGSPMAQGLVAEAKAFLGEIDRLLVQVTVEVVPADSAIAVDGRPLEVRSKDGPRPQLVAGTLPPGMGARVPAPTFELVLDPGAHVFTISRTGHTDAVVNRTFAPGSRSKLTLEVKLLPAMFQVTSNEQGAIVKLNASDVGPAPVEILRPAGAYRVEVTKEGFLPYQAQVSVKPGQEVKLRATLLEDKPSLAQRWWFWAGAAAVVAGGVVLTYALTRPEPEPPPYDRGTTGVLLTPNAVSW